MESRAAAFARTRPAAAMAVATGISRGTGFARTLALAWALGVTGLADAYNVANTAPNMLFQLAAGGVLSSAVVPLLAQSSSPAEREENANALFGIVIAIGVLASLVLAIGAPWFIRLLTLGGAGRADHADVVRVGSLWLLLFAPQILAYAVSVFCVGVLTTHRRLFLGAVAPVMTNVLTLVGVLAFVVVSVRRPGVRGVGDGAVLWLGVLTTLGVVVMAAIQFFGARRIQPSLRPQLILRHPAIRRAAGVAPWVALYVGVNQAGLAVVVAFASSVSGGVSAYQWAFTVMQLPYALIGVSILTAAFPRISESALRDPVAAAATVERALRRLLQLLGPAAGALIGIAPILGTALVGRSGDDLVAAGMAGFAVSLVPFSVFQLLTRACYAFRDARSPALVNIGVNVVNVAFDFLVLLTVDGDSRRLAGLALGHAASYMVGSGLLARQLEARHGVRVRGGGRHIQNFATAGGAATVLFVTFHTLIRPSDQATAAAWILVTGMVIAALPAARRVRNRSQRRALPEPANVRAERDQVVKLDRRGADRTRRRDDRS